MAERGKLITGARARFTIHGVKVGYARNVSITEEVRYEDVECLGNIEDEEHVPVSYKVTMQAGFFRVVGHTLKSLGLFPKTGSSAEEHLENILTTGDMTAQIEDTKEDRIIALVEQVRVATQGLQIDARGIGGTDVTFKAIRLKDESET